MPALLFCLLIVACTTTDQETTDLEERQHLIEDVIVLFPARREAELEEDVAFARCLKRELTKRLSPEAGFLAVREFQNALFPWFEPETAPGTVQELEALLSRPTVRERIAELKVHYVITIAGSTESKGFPGIICSYGCWGLAWQNKVSSLSAIVWDLTGSHQVGEVFSTMEGTTLIPAFILPIPLIADTEGKACESLAVDLADLLRD